MFFGVDYYPEQWPASRWETDAGLMSQAGISVVRLAEFAWAKMEPAEGSYQFEWLDQAIQILAAKNLKIILGTPTAAAPAWLSRSYPDTLPVDDQGRVRRFGSRRHYCPNSPVYRAHTRRIVSELARRYGQDERIIGWQVDNEFGGGKTARCYCPNCAAAFRTWLRKRYQTIDALNDAWGTVFWSQAYDDWSQVEPPILTVAPPNPSHVLDYYRFASDSFVEYQQLQIDLLRQMTAPCQFITHNFMGLFYDLDQYAMAKSLDLVTWDNYPTANPDRWRSLLYPPGSDFSCNDPIYAFDVGDPLITGMAHDLTRGLKNQPFWVMEQQCGHVNWGNQNPGVRPGSTRLWCWHAVACGAEAVIFFRWRATVFAQEQYHSGLLHHDASPGVGYRDLQALVAEKQQLDEIAAAPLSAEVALLLDYDDLWALQIQPHRSDFAYLRHLFAFYQAFQRLGVAVDLISSQVNLEKYALVIAPTMHLVDEAKSGALQRYVRQGGALLVGIRSGFKTSSGVVVSEPLPGLLRSLLGVTVIDWQSLPAGSEYGLDSRVKGLGEQAGYWVEALKPDDTGVDILARYTSGVYGGEAALTCRPVGRGRAYYLGFYPTPGQAMSLAAHLADQQGIAIIPHLPPGLIARRRGERVVLMNFTDAPVKWSALSQTYTIEPRGILLI